MTPGRSPLALLVLMIAGSCEAADAVVRLPATPAGGGPARLIGLAPDGSWAAFAARSDIGDPGDPLRDGRVQIWDLRTGTLHTSLPVESFWRTEPVAISPDARWLAYSRYKDYRPELRLIDLRSGKLARTIPHKEEFYRPIGFSADSSEVYVEVSLPSAWSKSRVIAWSTADGSKLREVKVPNYRSVTVGPDGKTAVVIVENHWKGHELWDLSSGKLIANLGRGSVGGEQALFVRGGREVALQVRRQYRPGFLLFDAAGKQLDTIHVPSKDKDPTERALSDDKATVVVREYYGVVSGYDAGKAEPRWRVDLKSARLQDLRFTPDGKRVTLVDAHERAWVLDAATGKTVHVLDPDYRAVKSLAFADGGKQLIAGMAFWPKPHLGGSGFPPEGFLLTWDTATGELKRAAGGVNNFLHAVYPSPSGDRSIVICGENKDRAEWWDLAAGKRLRTLAEPADKVGYFGAQADGRRVAGMRYVDGNAKETWVWETETGKRLPNLPAAGSAPLSFSADGEWMLVRDYSNGIQAVRVSTGKPTQLWKPANSTSDSRWPEDPVLLPDGERFVGFHTPRQYGRRDLYLYDNGRQVNFGTVKEWTTPIAVSPDGKFVAVGGKTQNKPNSVYVWRLPKLNPLDETTIVGGTIPVEEVPVKPVVLEGHIGEVFAVVFSPDGKTLATGGRDRLIRLWDVMTGTLRASLWTAPPRDPAAVPSDWAAFTPDGMHDGTPRGRSFLRFEWANPQDLHHPEKVRDALRLPKR